MTHDDAFVFASDDGMIEPCADLGDMLEAGDCLAKIWRVDRTGEPALEYRAKRGGLLTARHFPGLVKAGDCLAVIADVNS